LGQHLEQLPHFTRALVKSHLMACGWTFEDLDKPIIAIANSWNEFNHGHMPQRQIANRVKAGVRAAGGLPLEFNTIGPCDALAQGSEGMKYILPNREIIADSVEGMLRSQWISDGVVLISSCDKSTPGMLMAALRLDLPCVQICSGTCMPAISFSESKRIRKAFLDGEISERELAEGNSALYPQPGICPYMGTANSMNIFSEALGLSLSRSATIPAATNERMRAAYRTGQLAVELAVQGRRPSQFLTEKSFHNALIVLAAVSGSLNHLLHAPAVAQTYGVNIDFDLIAEVNAHTPQLCTINPSGSHSIADLHRAGGIPAVIKELLPLMNADCENVEGKTLYEIAEGALNLDPLVIRTRQAPVNEQGGVVILKGNIARQGAAMRLSTVPDGMMYFTGPAVTFDSEEQAMQAVEADSIAEGSIVIVKYEGPIGGPGMREMHRLVGAFAGRRVAIVTDGRFSGATGGLSIGYLRPEAALGGEIACVQDGDEITIDVTRCSIELKLEPAVLQERMHRLPTWQEKESSRLLLNYVRNYRSIST
jgi:dihydroxy-acid dehydratase